MAQIMINEFEIMLSEFNFSELHEDVKSEILQKISEDNEEEKNCKVFSTTFLCYDGKERKRISRKKAFVKQKYFLRKFGIANNSKFSKVQKFNRKLEVKALRRKESSIINKELIEYFTEVEEV